MKNALSDLGRRSAAEWGIRIVLGAGIAWVGVCAVRHSAADALSDRIELAHRLAPGDARITAKLARDRIMAQATKVSKASARDQAVLAEAEELARSALRADATAVSAAGTLGLSADLRGDRVSARRWFTYAEQLSRRDLPTQLWLLEDAVAREDIGSALNHYDVALRTKRAAADLLFPILRQASSDPAIAPELVKRLALQPHWTAAFIWHVATQTQDPEGATRLFIALRQARVPIADIADTALIDALLLDKKFDTAWKYYASTGSGADRRSSRDPNFIAVTENPSMLDWVPAKSETGLGATVQRGEKGGVFDFSAPSNTGGELLRQMQLLPPGRYVLEGRSSGIAQLESSRPFWSLKCSGDGRELGKIDLPSSESGEVPFKGTFVVPAGCPAQVLALTARASEDLAGSSGQITQVRLRPAE